MKLRWHDYLVSSLDNCTMKPCTETGLTIWVAVAFVSLTLVLLPNCC